MTDRDGFSSNALQILEARYFMKTETGERLDKSPADLFSRVADFVASAEKTKKEQQTWSRRFLNLMLARDFLPDYVRITPLAGQNSLTIFALVKDIKKYIFVMLLKDDIQNKRVKSYRDCKVRRHEVIWRKRIIGS